MSVIDETALHVVLYEGADTQPLAPADRFAVLTTLLQRGFAVRRALTEELVPAEARDPVLVVGRFAGGQTQAPIESLAGRKVYFRELPDGAMAAVGDLAERVRAGSGAAPHGEWKPWFPVIDYDRCTNCMQCLSFCLFGVYGVDEHQRIQAQNLDNCKTNCPACSRVCPEAAIMFPKYKAGPINGDVVRESDLGQEKMKVDISALLGGDVYSALRQRSAAAKVRFSKERDDKQALQERQRCLAQLAKANDIPPEALMSLPSAEEISRRAEEAKAKAAAALAAQPK